MQRAQQDICVGLRISRRSPGKARISRPGWPIVLAYRAFTVGLLAGAVWAGLCRPAPAAAQAEYSVTSDAWNGLSTLLALGRAGGLPITAPSRLSLSDLTPRDGLLIVFPQDAPPREDLAAFLREGGRIAVADDFGAAESWLRGFEIQRGPLMPGTTAPRLRGNRNVLIAEPSAPHPLSRDVPALVVNHPSVLHHAQLAPVLELAGSGAVVLAGAVGQGRLVVLSDPSALINNMLELSGNRTFAANLLGYLGQSGGRVFVVVGDAQLVGRYGELARSDRMARVKSALERVAQVKLPVGTLRVLSAMLALAMVLFALSAVPRRVQYLAAMRRARPQAAPVFAGDAGVLAYFAGASDEGLPSGAVRSLLVPLLRYRRGFEHALADRLSLDLAARERPTSRALLDAATRAGLPRALHSELKGLLDELVTLSIASELASPPYVTDRKFRAAVGTGERMLSALEALTAPRRRS